MYKNLLIGVLLMLCCKGIAQVPRNISLHNWMEAHAFPMANREMVLPVFPNGQLLEQDTGTYFTQDTTYLHPIRNIYGNWKAKSLFDEYQHFAITGMRLGIYGVGPQGERYDYSELDTILNYYWLPGHHTPAILSTEDRVKRFSQYWRVTRQDIDRHKQLWQQYKNNIIPFIPSSLIPGDILNWPGRGNPASRDRYGENIPGDAPYVNQDSDPAYYPWRGDYPKVPGDNNVLVQFSDAHTTPQSGLQPAGINGQLIAYTLSGGPLEKNTVFLQYTLENDGVDLDSFVFGMSVNHRFLTRVIADSSRESVVLMYPIDTSQFALALVNIKDPVITMPNGQSIKRSYEFLNTYNFAPGWSHKLHGWSDDVSNQGTAPCKRRAINNYFTMGGRALSFPKGASLTFTLAFHATIFPDSSYTCDYIWPIISGNINALQQQYGKRGLLPTQANKTANVDIAFPVPAQTYLELNHHVPAGATLLLRNYAGEVVRQWMHMSPGERLSVEGLADGFYLLEAISPGDDRITQKIIIQ